jgi:hypothetical protein
MFVPVPAAATLPAAVTTSSVFACVAIHEFSPVILMGFGLWQLCRSVL